MASHDGKDGIRIATLSDEALQDFYNFAVWLVVNKSEFKTAVISWPSSQISTQCCD